MRPKAKIKYFFLVCLQVKALVTFRQKLEPSGSERQLMEVHMKELQELEAAEMVRQENLPIM